jgi:hypothetical protein
VNRRRKSYMKRVIYLVMVALVAMLMLVPSAMAEVTMEKETTTTVEKDLPKSGGVPVGSILLPAAALLVGGGILGFAILRRR